MKIFFCFRTLLADIPHHFVKHPKALKGSHKFLVSPFVPGLKDLER